MGQGQDVAALGAALAGLVADVHLQQDVLGDVQFGRLLFHGVHEMLGVDGLDHVHFAHDELHFVGLQVPDEVDLSPLIGVVLQVGHQLLHAVLAADGDARPDGVANGVGSLHFGGGHQGDVLGVPSGRFGGLTHVLPHGRDVRGDGFIALCLWHGFNVPPFRRLVLRRPAPPGPRPAGCGYLLRSWERL